VASRDQSGFARQKLLIELLVNVPETAQKSTLELLEKAVEKRATH
jgi:hypothetical protein